MFKKTNPKKIEILNKVDISNEVKKQNEVDIAVATNRETKPIKQIKIPDYFKKNTCDTLELCHQMTLKEILCEEE